MKLLLYVIGVPILLSIFIIVASYVIYYRPPIDKEPVIITRRVSTVERIIDRHYSAEKLEKNRKGLEKTERMQRVHILNGNKGIKWH